MSACTSKSRGSDVLEWLLNMPTRTSILEVIWAPRSNVRRMAICSALDAEGDRLSPQDSYQFDRLEEDIDNVRVVRHPAEILKLNIVAESGEQLKDGGIFAHYELEEEHALVSQTAHELGMEVIDLLAPFSRFDVGDLRFSLQDPHPNRQGHLEAAKVLFDHLLSQHAPLFADGNIGERSENVR